MSTLSDLQNAQQIMLDKIKNWAAISLNKDGKHSGSDYQNRHEIARTDMHLAIFNWVEIEGKSNGQ